MTTKALQRQATSDELLTVKDVCQILSIKERTVWQWVQTGQLPPPVRLTKRVLRWKASVIQAYLDSLNS